MRERQRYFEGKTEVIRWRDRCSLKERHRQFERETEVVKKRDKGCLKERQRYIWVVRKGQEYDVKHKERLSATLVETVVV